MKWWISSSIFVITCDFGGGMFFQSATLIGPLGHLVDHLPQDVRRFAASPRCARGSDRSSRRRVPIGDVEVVLLVVEIRMFPAQIVIDAAAAQVRAGEAVGNRAILR